jgi:hypothetical protein
MFDAMFWLVVLMAFLFGIFVTMAFSIIWKLEYNRMTTPLESTNRVKLKCPYCNKDLTIEVTK